MDHSPVLIERDGTVAIITLNRPDKANALSAEMRASLARRLSEAGEDDGVDVVLIQAAGGTFCGGLDLADLPQQPPAWRQRVLAAQANHLAVLRMPKVVIAAVQGAVVGGGASLALSADILIAAEDAQFSFPFVHLGIVPDGGSSYFLQAKLGVPLALDLLLTGGKMAAAEAAQRGLTRRIVAAEQLHATARALAKDLARVPREARMLTKSLCAQRWAAGLETYLAHEADAFAFATSTEGHHAALKRVQHKAAKR